MNDIRDFIFSFHHINIYISIAVRIFGIGFQFPLRSVSNGTVKKCRCIFNERETLQQANYVLGEKLLIILDYLLIYEVLFARCVPRCVVFKVEIFIRRVERGWSFGVWRIM